MLTDGEGSGQTIVMCVCVCLCVCVILSVHVVAFPTPLLAAIIVMFIPFRLYGLHHCVQNVILL